MALFLFSSDTSGEKQYEEFYTSSETVDFDKFEAIGVIKHTSKINLESLRYFDSKIKVLLQNGGWEISDLLELFERTIPNFQHIDKGRNLDQKM